MDPHLFDIVWEVYRESGSTQPIDVLSGYRSPQTNAMLRRRSRQVAEHSAHMEGKAIDAHFVDVGTARIRDIAMRMQAGGVGFYPSGAQPWVHIDSGPIRYWPRMSRDALARLFPDGKTVFIPADGQPMPGYEQARAEIEARGGEIQTAGGGGLFAWLFGARGGGADDAEEEGGGEATGVARGGRGGGAGIQIADAGPDAIATAKRNLPTGPTYAGPVAPPSAQAARPRCWAGRGRQGQAQLAARPDLRQRRRADAPGQASGCRVAATGRRRERRLADPWAEGPRAAAAAAAERSRRRERRLAVPWAEASRRCRRSGRPISTSRSRSPTLLCLRRARPIWSLRRGKGSARTRPGRRRRTKGPASSARSRNMARCRRSSPTASTARRSGRSRWRKARPRRNTTTTRCWRGRPSSPRPCRQCRSPMSGPRPRRRLAKPLPAAPLRSAAMTAEDLARMFGGLPSFDAFKTTAPAVGDLRGPQ